MTNIHYQWEKISREQLDDFLLLNDIYIPLDNPLNDLYREADKLFSNNKDVKLTDDVKEFIENQTDFGDLVDDVRVIISYNSSYKDVIALCEADYRKYCDDPKFWSLYIMKRYNLYIDSRESTNRLTIVAELFSIYEYLTDDVYDTYQEYYNEFILFISGHDQIDALVDINTNPDYIYMTINMLFNFANNFTKDIYDTRIFKFDKKVLLFPLLKIISEFTERENLMKDRIVGFIYKYELDDLSNPTINFTNLIIRKLIENTELDIIKLFMSYHNIERPDEINKEFILNDFKFTGFLDFFGEYIFHRDHLLEFEDWNEDLQFINTKFQEFVDFLNETYDMNLVYLPYEVFPEVAMSIDGSFMFNKSGESV